MNVSDQLTSILQYFPHSTIEGELIFPVIRCAKQLGIKSPYYWCKNNLKAKDYITHNDQRIKWITEENLYGLILSSNEPIIKELAKWLCHCALIGGEYYNIDWIAVISYLTENKI